MIEKLIERVLFMVVGFVFGWLCNNIWKDIHSSKQESKR